MAVLDTSALLHWPIERCRGQVVSILQQTELSRVDEQRWMLIETLDMEWRTASTDERQVVLDLAAKTGDLPRLSDVDIDTTRPRYCKPNLSGHRRLSDEKRCKRSRYRCGGRDDERWKTAMEMGIALHWMSSDRRGFIRSIPFKKG